MKRKIGTEEDPVAIRIDATNGDHSSQNIITFDQLRDLPMYMRNDAIKNMRDKTENELISKIRRKGEKKNGTNTNDHNNSAIDPDWYSNIHTIETDLAKDTW